jgi:Rieske Fe-S protein
MKQIMLSNSSEVALVDDDDYELAMKFSWYIDSNGYVAAVVKLHSLVMPSPDRTDHVNQNPLDNRRENLRHATRAQNRANTKTNRNNKSGFKGVSIRQDSGRKNKFEASIRFDGSSKHLGCFPTAEEAGMAYDAAARKRWGEFACVNFPTGNERGARRTEVPHAKQSRNQKSPKQRKKASA